MIEGLTSRWQRIQICLDVHDVHGEPLFPTKTPGFAEMLDELDLVKAQLAQMPTRAEIARVTLRTEVAAQSNYPG
jgi:hypothetical protein